MSDRVTCPAPGRQDLLQAGHQRHRAAPSGAAGTPRGRSHPFSASSSGLGDEWDSQRWSEKPLSQQSESHGGGREGGKEGGRGGRSLGGEQKKTRRIRRQGEDRGRGRTV